MAMQSPSSLYYSERYLKKRDHWTRVQDITSLTDALLNKLADIIKPSQRYTILDVGCGTLWTAFKIVDKFPNVRIHGIDFAYDAIIAAYSQKLAKCGQRSISFEKADFFAFDSGIVYDAILDSGLFHHLVTKDWPKYVKQLEKFLLPGGSLFIRSFHPLDKNWNKPFPGGHIRKKYYCHYHILSSLNDIFSDICITGKEIELCNHYEHVEGLYQFVRSPSDKS